jgi:uncharacterized membrane protein
MGDSLRPFWYAAGAGVAVLIAIGLGGCAILPDRVPTSFDFAGHAQAWGPKWTVMLLPGMGALMLTILAFVTRFQVRPNLPFPVREENTERVNALAKKMTAALSVVIIGGFVVLEIETVLAARAGSLPPIFLATVVAFVATIFAYVAYYLVRIYRLA